MGQSKLTKKKPLKKKKKLKEKKQELWMISVWKQALGPSPKNVQRRFKPQLRHTRHLKTLP